MKPNFSKFLLFTFLMFSGFILKAQDLALTKSASISQTTIGSSVTYSLTVLNQGGTTMTGVIVEDILPPGATYLTHSTVSGSALLTGTTLSWNIGTIPAATASVTLTVTVSLDREGVHTNKAEIKASSADLDSTPGNNNSFEDDIAKACTTVPFRYCAGKPIEINISAESGFASYQWFKDGNPIAGAVSSSYTITAQGSYTYTVSGGGLGGTCMNQPCCPTVVEVYPNPVASPSGGGTICASNTLYLNSTDAGVGSTYAWTGPSGFSSTLRNPSITNAQTNASGIYTLIVTNIQGCTASSTVSALVNPTPSPVATNETACQGTTAVLEVSDLGPGTTYNWVGPNAYASGIQNIYSVTISDVQTVNEGIYSVTVVKSGCSATTTLSLTVPLIPTVAVSGSTVCEGSTVNLTASNAVGGGASYLWSGPSGFGTTAQNPSISNSTTSNGGIYSVTVSRNFCVYTATTAVVINTKPSLGITGVACSPDLLTYNINFNVIGGTVVASAGILVGNTVTAIPIGTNSVTLTATSNKGCVSTIVVNAPTCSCGIVNSPVSGGDKTICQGQPIPTLTATVANGETIDWYSAASGGTLLATGTTIYLPAGIGTYYAEARNTTTNCKSAVRTAITLMMFPAVNSTTTGATICEGNTLNISATDAGSGSTYSWTGPNAFTSSTRSIIVSTAATPSMSGNYSVLVTRNGCTATAVAVAVVTAKPTLTILNAVCNASLTTYTVNFNLSGGTVNADQGVVAGNQVISIPVGTNVTLTATSTSGGCTTTQVVASPNCACPAIVAPTSGGDKIICQGQPIPLLTASIGLGETVDWYTVASGGVPIALSSTSYAATSPSVYYAETRNLVTGCRSATRTPVTLTINPLPIATATGGTVCEGGNVSLVAGNSGAGAIYSWGNTSGFVGTGQVITLNNVPAAANGVYSLSVVMSGCSAVATANVVINSRPTLSVVSAVCNPSLTNYNVTFNSTNGTVTATAGTVSANQVINIPTGLNVTLTATSSGGCIVTQGVSAPNCSCPAIPTPVSTGDKVICSGASIPALNVTVPSGLTVDWYSTSSGGSTLVTNSSSYTPVSSGTYYAETRNAVTGCISSTRTAVSLTISPAPVPVATNETACQGTTAVLEVSDLGAGTTYNWVGPNAYASGIQNIYSVSISNVQLVNQGIYTVTVIKNSCSATTTLSLTVPLTPLVTLAGSSVCSGGTATLTSSDPGGLGVSYSWSGPNGFGSTAQNPTITSVTPAASGIYNLTVIRNFCVFTATTSVAVNAQPSITFGTINCSSDLQTYNVNFNAIGGVVSLNPNVGILGLNTISSIPIGTNSIVFTVTSPENCVISQTVNAPNCSCGIVNTPISTGDKSICQGATIPALTVNVGGSETADWYLAPSGGTAISTGTLSYTPTSAGTYYAEARNSTSSCKSAVRIPITLIINPVPTTIVSVNSICEGGALNLTASDAGAGATYTWSGPNGFTSTQRTPVLSNAMSSATGNYTVLVAKNGCASSAVGNGVVIAKPTLAILNALCNPSLTSYIVNFSVSGGTVTSNQGIVSGSQVVNVPIGTNVTLTATSASGGCTVTQLVASPNCACPAISAPISAGNQVVCQGRPIPLLTASVGSNEVVDWYAVSNGGSVLLSNSNNYLPSTTGIYYAEARNIITGCKSSSRTAISLTINPLPVASATGGTVCEGGTVNLVGGDSGSGATYTWIGQGGFSASGQTITLSNTATSMSGVYSLSVMLNGCSAIATANVVINPKPTLSVVSSICNSNLTTYTVTFNSTGGTVTSSSGVVSGNQVINIPTGLNVTLTASSGSGCVVTQNVTAPNCSCPAIAAPISGGDKVVCVGVAMPVLSVTPPSGMTVDWYNTAGGGTAAAMNTSSYTPVTSGTYYAESRNSVTGCVSGLRTAVSVTTNPAPVALVSNAIYCQGTNAVLTSTNAGSGAVYNWSGPNAYASTGQSITINNVTTIQHQGSYTVTVTKDGCTATATANLSVPAVPVVTIGGNSICEGSTINLTSSDPGSGSSWSWSGPNGFGSTSQNPSIASATVAATGVYSVTVNRGLCQFTSTTTIAVSSNPTINISNVSCSADLGTYSITFLATGGTVMASSGNIVGNTVTGIPSSTSSVTLTATSSLGCVSTRIVNAPNCSCSLVNAPISNGDKVICSGEAIPALTVLAGASETADWYSAASGGTAIATGTLSYVPATSGTYYAEARNSTSNCKSNIRTSVTLTINTVPVTSVSSSPVCADATLTLTASDAGAGSTYSWSGPNGFSSTQRVPMLANATVSMNGNYSVTVTRNACTVVAVGNGVVNAKPSLGIVSVVCSPSLTMYNINFVSTGGTVTSSMGSVGAGQVSNIPAGVDVILTATSPSGCVITQAVNAPNCACPVVNPPTNLGNRVVCQGVPIPLLTVNAGSGETVDWYATANSSTPIATGTNNYAATTTGIYYAEARNATSNCVSLTRTPVSLTINPLPVASATGGIVCEGVSVNLVGGNAGAGSVYTWVGQGGFTASGQTITLSNTTASMSGVYSLNINRGGCSAVATASVQINAKPTLTVSNIACNASLTTYTVTFNSTGTVTATAGIVLGNQVINIPTGLNVTLTASSGSGCIVSQNVTAPNCSCPAIAAPVSGGNKTICSGNAIPNLTAIAPSGFVIDWYNTPNGGSPVATNSAIYIPLIEGDYYAESRNAITGCVSSLRTKISVLVSANPPALATDQTICKGEQANITAVDAGASSNYIWEGPNGFASAGQVMNIPNAQVAATGVYSLTVVRVGCSATNTVNLIVHTIPAAIATGSMICEGTDATLTAQDAGSGTSYIWTGPNGFSSIAQNPVLTESQLIQSGTYNLVVTKNGCSATATTSIAVNAKPVITINNVDCATDLATYSVMFSATGGTVVASSGTVINGNEVTGILAGSSVTLTATSPSGCIKSIIINAPNCSCPAIVNAPASAGNKTICQGQPMPTLSVTVASGETVDWYTTATGGTPILTGQLNYTPTAVGTYYAQTRKILSGCVSSIRTPIVFTINTTPVALATGSIVCAGTDATLKAADAGAGASYVWSGVNFTSSNQNPILAAAQTSSTGDYTVTVTKTGCTATAVTNITVRPKPVLTLLTAVCSVDFNTYNITVNLSGGTLTSSAGSVIGNTVTAIPKNVNVVLTATGVGGCTTVLNVTAPICACPFINAPINSGNKTICQGEVIPALLVSVGANETVDWYSGASSSPAIATGITNYTPTVAGTYYAETRNTLSGCKSSIRTPVILIINAASNASVAGSIACEGTIATLSAADLGAGTTYEWKGPAGFNSTAQNPTLPNVQTISTGAYTVTVSKNACTATGIANITVNAKPTFVVGTVVCASNFATYSVNFTATNATTITATAGTVGLTQITNIPSGQNITITATSSQNCSVTQVVNSPDCNCPAVNAPVSPQNRTICQGQIIPTLSVSVSATETVDWYDVASGGTVLIGGQGVTSYTPLLAGTFYAETRSTITNCKSSVRTPVTFVITPNPVFTATGSQVCEGETTKLKATDAGAFASYEWAGPNNFISLEHQPEIRNATVASHGVYTIKAANNGCTSTATAKITVFANPVLTIINKECATNLKTYKVTFNVVGGTVIASAGTVSGTQVINVPKNTNLTITAVSPDGCKKIVEVLPPDCVCPVVTAPISAGNKVICEGQPIPALVVTVGLNETVDWYSAPSSGGAFLTGNASYTPSAPGTYYAETRNTITDCVSGTRTAVILNVKPRPLAMAAGSLGCVGGNGYLLAADAGNGAVYSWTGPNAFSATGINPMLTNIQTTANGTYTLTVVQVGCTTTATTTLSTVPAPIASVTGKIVCEGETINLVAIDAGTGANYAWRGPAGFNSTGLNPTIDNAQDIHEGVYTLTVNRLACSATATTSVRVNRKPTLVINTITCATDLATYTVNFTAAGGTVTASHGNVIGTSQVTNIPATQDVTITVKNIDNCEVKRIVLAPNCACPVIPTAATGGDVTICQGQAIPTLSATPLTGETIDWYTVESGGQPIAIGQVSFTPAGGGTYYAQTRNIMSGCKSATRTPVKLIITTIPNIAVSASPACEGTSAQLSAIDAGSGATYSWFGPNNFSSSERNPTVQNIPTAGGGAYTLTVAKNGCTATAVATLLVNPKPVLDITNTLCSANLTTYSVTYLVTGGTVTASSGTVGSGQVVDVLKHHNLILTATSPQGCVTTQTVSSPNCVCPNIPVPVSAGDISICEGDVAPALTVTVGPDETADWYDNANGVNALAVGTTAFRPQTTGTFYAQTRNRTTNCKSEDRVMVRYTVNPKPIVSAIGGAICDGADATLTVTNAGNGASYAWAGPSGFSSTAQNPIVSGATTAANGAYSVTVTKAGCSNSAAVSVTVGAKPILTIGVITCAADLRTYTINYTAAGGIVTSSEGTVVGSTVIDIPIGKTAVLTARSPQNCIVTQTVNSPNCACPSIPTPISGGDKTICQGQLVPMLVANVNANETVDWYNAASGGSVVALNTTSYQPTMPGTYYAQARNILTSCKSANRTPITFTINPKPVASVTGMVICENGSISLSTPNAGASASYLWTGPIGFSTAVQNPVINNAAANNSGTYSLVVTLAGCTATSTALITVNPKPVLTLGGVACAADLNTYTVNFTLTNGTLAASLGTVQTNKVINIPKGQNVELVATSAANCTITQTITAPTCICPTVSAPVSSGNQTICFGAAIPALAVTVATGETVDWYSVPVGGVAIVSSTLTYTPVTAATYYVETRNASTGCVSGVRTPVRLTITSRPDFTATGSVVCETGTATLVADALAASALYAWKGPNGFISDARTPIIANAQAAATGIYTVTATLNNCSVTTTANVTVSVKPSLSLGAAACSADLNTWTLNFTVSNGTVHASHGIVSGNKVTGIPKGQSITLTAINPSNCTVSMAVTAPTCGCLALMEPRSLGDKEICQGQSIPTLTATAGTNEVIDWYRTLSGGDPILISTNSYTPTLAGTYYAETRSTVTGCRSGIRTPITLIINAIPVATATGGTVCEGNNFTLMAEDAGSGASYEWKGPNGFISNERMPVIENTPVTASGNYSVTVTKRGCLATAVAIVNVNKKPIITIGNVACSEDLMKYTVNFTIRDGAVATNLGTLLENRITEIPVGAAVTMTASSGAGCSVTQLVQSPKCACQIPNAPVVTQTQIEVCQGKSLPVLTAVVPIGTTIQWFSTPTGGTPIGSGATFQPSNLPVQVGTCIFYAEAQINNCHSAVRVPVTLIIKPTPSITVSSNGTVCAGNDIKLFASTVDGARYVWAGPNGFSSILQNPVATNTMLASGGIYTLTVNLDGCTATATTSVVVSPAPVLTANNTGPVCEDGTFNLFSADIGAGAIYTWRGPNNFASDLRLPTNITATNLSGGTYMVIATLNGCTLTATTNVAMNLKPSITNITGLCETTNSNATYMVEFAANGTIIASGGNVIGSKVVGIPINQSITLKATTGAGCETIRMITPPSCSCAVVNAPVNMGDRGVCQGSTLPALTVTVGTGETADWYAVETGGSPISSGALNFTPTAAGTYYAETRNIITGCKSIVRTAVKLSVNSIPVVITSANSPVCEGSDLMLTATSLPNASYQWLFPDGTVANEQNPVRVMKSAFVGTYNLTVVSNGCTANATAIVQMKPKPTLSAADIAVCEGKTISLVAQSNASTFGWTGPAGFSSSQQMATISAANASKAGIYTITVGLNGCTAMKTVNVGVESNPKPIAANTSPICINGIATLSSSAESGSTYKWSGPNGYTSTQQNPNIMNVVSGGVYSVTVSHNACTATATTSISTMPLPFAEGRGSEVCEGMTATMEASDAGAGALYLWKGPNGFSSANQNASISGASAAAQGIYTLIVTKNQCSVVTTVAVVINPMPLYNIAGADVTCTQGVPNSNGKIILAGFRPTDRFVYQAGNTYTGSATYNTATAIPASGILVSNLTNPNTQSQIYTVRVFGVGNCYTDKKVSINKINCVLQCIVPDAPLNPRNISICDTLTTLNESLSVANAPAGYQICWYDAATGGSLLATNTNVFAPSPLPTASTTYYAEAKMIGVNGCVSTTRTPVQLIINTRPKLTVSGTRCSPDLNSYSVSYTVDGGTVSATVGTVRDGQVTNIPKGRSVTLTAITANGCSVSQTVTAPVCDCPIVAPAINVADRSICINDAIPTLEVVIQQGATADWYASATGGEPIASSNTRYTPTTSGTYYVEVTDNASGCKSAVRTPVSLTIKPLPVPVATGSTVCEGSTSTLVAKDLGDGVIYEWSGPNGFISSERTPIISTNSKVNMGGTYSLKVTMNGCTATTTTTVAINAMPTLQINLIGCSPDKQTYNVNLIATGGNVTTSLGALIGANAISVPIGSNTTISVTSAAGCVVNQVVSSPNCSCTPMAPPVIGEDKTLCVGQTIPSVSASVKPGETVDWFETPIGGTVLGTGITFKPTIPANKVGICIFYAETRNLTTGCKSATRTSVRVIVKPLPTVTVSNTTENTTVCVGGDVQVAAISGKGANYTWTGPAGFTSNLHNPIISNVSTSSGGIYTVRVLLEGCVASAVTLVKVNTAPIASVSNSGPVCEGQTFNLTALNGGTGATYTWAGANNFVSEQRNPTGINGNMAASGVYTLKVSLNGCIATATTSVKINAKPMIDGITAICEPSRSTYLVDYTVLGGTLTASGGVISAGRVINVPLVTNITLTANSTTGCSNSVVVLAPHCDCPEMPAPVSTGNKTICEAENIPAVAVNVGPNEAVDWFATLTGGTPLMIGSTSYTPATVGTYYAESRSTVTNCHSVVRTPVSITRVIIPAIAASSNSPTCAAETLMLNVTGVVGATYRWTGPNALTWNVQSPVINNVSDSYAGTYEVTVTLNGCTKKTATNVDIKVKPTVSTENVEICEGATLQLKGVSNATTVAWTGPSGFTSTQLTPTISNVNTINSGVYTIKATNNGCTATASAEIAVKSSPKPIANNTSPICSTGFVTLSSTAPAGATFQWAGPNGFASIEQNPNVARALQSGTYTVSISLNGCIATATTSMIVNAIADIQVNVKEVSCLAGQALNDGVIRFGTYSTVERYDMVSGNTYGGVGTATYATAKPIPADGIIMKDMANPTQTQFYTVRIFNSNGCFIDRTVTFNRKDCAAACSLSIDAITAGACDEISNTHPVTVTVTYDTGTADELVINGITYPLQGKSGTQTFTLPRQYSNGQSKTITATFKKNTSCTYTRTYQAPVSCSHNPEVDPAGYAYCEETGQIIKGGKFSFSGPGVIILTADGTDGYYAFLTDGTPGIYTVTYTPPPGFSLSTKCLARGDILDPTGQANPLICGNGRNGNTEFLTSNECTKFFLKFNLAPGDPYIINNNIPLSGCCTTPHCVPFTIQKTKSIK